MFGVLCHGNITTHAHVGQQTSIVPVPPVSLLFTLYNMHLVLVCFLSMLGLELIASNIAKNASCL